MQDKKYFITLEQEVLSEVCEGVLAYFYKFLKDNSIDTRDKENQLALLYQNMCHIKEDIIGNKYTSLDELKKVEGYFVYVKKFIEGLGM